MKPAYAVGGGGGGIFLTAAATGLKGVPPLDDMLDWKWSILELVGENDSITYPIKLTPKLA